MVCGYLAHSSHHALSLLLFCLLVLTNDRTSFCLAFHLPLALGHGSSKCIMYQSRGCQNWAPSSLLVQLQSTRSISIPGRAKARSGLSHWLLNLLLESPLWKLVLAPQAKSVMLKTAEANGIPWTKARDWIERECRSFGELDVPLGSISYPDYYKQRYHAYDMGNLCWEAAFEQEIASRAVGARNFPAFKDRGEDAFRDAFDSALSSLGATVPDQGVVLDFGCGTGASTRRLARRWKSAKNVIGIDLSPYFVKVGSKLLELQPKSFEEDGTWVTTILPDPRIELRVGDISNNLDIPDCSADVISLQFVLHELPLSSSKAVIDEAFRLLKPNGQLWICEMDFDSPAYAAQRANAILFSLLRATEPYLDEYADGMAELRQRLSRMFSRVQIKAATGRHYALIATKTNEGKALLNPTIIDDKRFDIDGNYVVSDTHLKLWESSTV
jgi:ubiquinone/menaquinone biosynthesis C-methylase UbiE